MGDRLVADIGRIRSSAYDVRSTSSRFNGASSLVAEYRSDLGSTDLANALDDFASNWKIHRERLCEDLEKFADWAVQAADGYAQADADLAAVLTEGPK
ncbi:hypothetical protein [Nocardioides pantholopis]|uniref:hypothetical protein n=1 Tax=Nocardioides pantholopis TaxID=2483798 RepID=UPI000F083056|nr:hypothetical protein [Nocardioides pantholopis]